MIARATDSDTTSDKPLSLHVLVAEDNPINQKTALAILDHLGCTADLAENGSIAVAKAKANSYDLILMDISMPFLDGYEATRNIREHGSELPIIALTANAINGERENCLRAGMNAYITKPYDADTLAAAIRQCLGTLLETPPATQAHPHPAADAAVFDPAVLENTFANQPGISEQLLISFIEQAPGMAASIQDAWSSGDFPELKRRAHKAKGSAATVGCEAFRAHALALENAAAENNAAACKKLIAELPGLLAEALDAIADHTLYAQRRGTG